MRGRDKILHSRIWSGKQQPSRTRGLMLSSIAGLRRYLRKVAVEYNISRLNALEQSCRPLRLLLLMGGLTCSRFLRAGCRQFKSGGLIAVGTLYCLGYCLRKLNVCTPRGDDADNHSNYCRLATKSSPSLTWNLLST